MRRDKLAILAMFVLVLGGTLAMQMIRGDGDKLDPSPVVATVFPPSATGEFRGFSLQLNTGDDRHPFEQYIDEIARTGANTICFVVPGYQENGSSTSIFIEARKTPSDQRTHALIARAKMRGLRVVLMPIVLLENPRDGEWRGKISPSNWEDWWDHYANFVMHYAWIAASSNVDIFMVGSELISTETQTKHWQDVIAKVRTAFKGRLSYSSNWDHYTVIKYWQDLDVIGMTTYYDLTGGREPTLDRLLEAWKPIKKEVLEWQATIGRPIIFTEVGWPNQVTCAQYPWDYYRSPDQPDPQAQANCFEAFFRTWVNEKSVTGFLVWEWRNHPSQTGGPKDTSYVPCGKEAMNIIQRYFQYLTPAKKAPASAPALATPVEEPAKEEPVTDRQPAKITPANPAEEAAKE